MHRPNTLRASILFAAAALFAMAGCAAPQEGTDEEPRATADLSGVEGEDPGWAAAMAQNEAHAKAEASATQNTPEGEIATTSQALGSARGKSISTEARREYVTLNLPTSYYSHTSYFNETTNTRRADCTGFADYVISRVQPTGYSLVPHTSGGYRPDPIDWYNYLVNRPSTASTTTASRWRRILKVTSLIPGDVVAWLRPPTSTSTSKGHVMIVDGLPRAGRSGEWLVPVIDSTSTPHHGDSRDLADRTGIGAGTIGLKADATTGKPIGYWWSGGYSSTLDKTSIALGRLE
jgi:hypothetical protein